MPRVGGGPLRIHLQKSLCETLYDNPGFLGNGNVDIYRERKKEQTKKLP